jgi:hypothetical protein
MVNRSGSDAALIDSAQIFAFHCAAWRIFSSLWVEFFAAWGGELHLATK